MSPTLAKKLQQIEKEPRHIELDIHEFVHSASNVIAPLGPISTFAARHPWVGMEQHSFEQVARRLQHTNDIDLYPSNPMIQFARNKGEINPHYLEISLQRWLDTQRLDLPRVTAEQYCRAALHTYEPSLEFRELPELKKLVKKLNRIQFQITEKKFLITYSQRLEQLGVEKTATNLNLQIIKWCKLFLDESQAVWTMPNRDKGFYHAWKKLVPYDPAIKPAIRSQLHNLPIDAGQALMEALLKLEIPYTQIQNYLEAHLLSLPGWAGMMLWRSQESAQDHSLLTEYLAVRLSLEYAFIHSYLPLPEQKLEEQVQLETLIASWLHWGELTIHEFSQLSPTELKARLMLASRFDQILRNQLWLEAWEKTYEEQIIKLLSTKREDGEGKAKTIEAQFVFCIDVRSEPFRRKLEQAGSYETIGAAGFFGLPIETCELGSQHTHNSLPVMFKPQHRIKEEATESEFLAYQQRKQTAYSLSSAFKMMKQNLLSSLVLPEISGPWLGLQTLARSFVPKKTAYAARKIKETWLHKPSTELSLDHVQTKGSELPIGFSLDEKILYVKQALKTMGLADHFAPLVVICGHGSHSTNNPYASALDCGACGGASSGFNARVLAALCNLPEVRNGLIEEGIAIPKETIFAAAEHITTLDQLKWLYVPELSDSAQTAFDSIEACLPKICEEANAERIHKLPHINHNNKNPKSEAARLAEDWSEARPEWGLARNAAFIIGERRLTQKCNLEGRAFLHSYNWKKDKKGSLLANIITGPGTVCQWINLQYYASTVAPHYYGSGNKATQTVTAGIGVMQGNASDLLSGLPWQSVMQSDLEFYHSPLRLLVIIQAPKDYVERLLKNDPAFNQKLRNGWIRLASIDPEGNWKSWS
ncbi:DUF2309 family protein [Bacillus sp. BRMEA1]|uniref:DUF2309 domain-containing protein n=1 Tax=Neobacillus endophyticus TaxID=2738405 RepID=UPI0015667859|nr:putative inorganic carbon transporter subunit DabA [Neobacillus endophyticus]NRD76229.1 DUF2309 family protein [Neobacillus endophyticus]